MSLDGRLARMEKLLIDNHDLTKNLASRLVKVEGSIGKLLKSESVPAEVTAVEAEHLFISHSAPPPPGSYPSPAPPENVRRSERLLDPSNHPYGSKVSPAELS